MPVVIEFTGRYHGSRSLDVCASLREGEAVLEIKNDTYDCLKIGTVNAGDLRELGRVALALAVRLEKQQELAALIRGQQEEAEKEAKQIETTEYPRPKK